VEESAAYQGREQTLLKHHVLGQYLSAWAFKMGSVARKMPTHIWYVDCFAGPWKSQADSIEDTSVYIGLQALNQVLARWAGDAGRGLQASAIFVEADSSRYEALCSHVERLREGVDAHVLHCEFGQAVPEIQKLLGTDAGFLFVDPTGWKGVDMKHIAPLVQQPRRDVIINLMYNDINRFKAETEREWLVEQLQEFFGLDDLSRLAGLDEHALIDVYRQRLKERGSLAYTTSLAVPAPTKNRTIFHLVLGCHHREALRVFRDAEQKVIGREAKHVRDRARSAQEEQRSGQLSLGLAVHEGHDARYRALHERALVEVPHHVVAALANKPTTYGEMWPDVLERWHLTESELAHLVVNLARAGKLQIDGLEPGQRRAHNANMLRRRRQ